MQRLYLIRYAALWLAGAASAAAHDIPDEVTVQVFLRPQGGHLDLLVRVPLKAIRDAVFPESAGGYLDIPHTEPMLADAATQWISPGFIEIDENGSRLPGKPRVAATALALESDRSFASFAQAAARLTAAPLASDVKVVWSQTMLDAWFEYPIHSAESRFSIRPNFARLGLVVVTVLRFVTPAGDVRPFEFTGDPGLVHLDPNWYQAAGRFVRLGFLHILSGTDHLLFLVCLVTPFRRFRSLVPVVTAFTVAHSVTLLASAYDAAPDALWFPPLIETLIAVSIVYMALENIAGGVSITRRWLIAFGFGLVHGFGFSFALKQTLQFAGTHLLTSLLAFNTGVELGQLAVLVVLVPVLEFLFRRAIKERMGIIIVSALVAHTAWHWMTERASILGRYRFEWPQPGLGGLATALRWLTLALLAAAGWWLARRPRVRD